jgi:hypothetical protein
MLREKTMGRREMLGTLGLTGAAVAASPFLARAQERTSPAGAARELAAATPHDRMYEECTKACSECMNVCNKTAHHCFEQLKAGKQEHAPTLHLTMDSQEFCANAAKLVARRSSLAGSICKACAEACDQCAAACEKLSSDAQMVACARECRDCAQSCRQMLKHLGTP